MILAPNPVCFNYCIFLRTLLYLKLLEQPNFRMGHSGTISFQVSVPHVHLRVLVFSHQWRWHVCHLQLHSYHLHVRLGVQPSLPLHLHLPLHLCGSLPLHLHYHGHLRDNQELLHQWFPSIQVVNPELNMHLNYNDLMYLD